MVEQFAQFIARVVFLKETHRTDAAMVEVNDFCGKVFELGVDELRVLPLEALHAICVMEGEFVPDRAVMLGSLLKEVADLDRLNPGPLRDPCQCLTRSLYLLLAAYGDGTQALPLDAVSTLELVIERSAACELPTQVQRLLAGFFEINGFYSDAEDCWFEVIGEAEASETESGEAGMLAAAVADGIAFYHRLLDKTDDDLADGGLPRDEVHEGLAELQARRGN